MIRIVCQVQKQYTQTVKAGCCLVEFVIETLALFPLGVKYEYVGGNNNTALLHMLVRWQTPGMCTLVLSFVPCPWKTLLMDHSFFPSAFLVKNMHGLGNFYNTVTVAQRIEPICHIYDSKLQFTNDC